MLTDHHNNQINKTAANVSLGLMCLFSAHLHLAPTGELKVSFSDFVSESGS